MYGQPYPTFQLLPDTLTFEVLQAFYFKWVACLTFVYFTATAWDGVQLLPVGFGRDIFKELGNSYRPDIWTTYLLNLFSKAFDIGETDSGEFSGIVLCCPI